MMNELEFIRVLLEGTKMAFDVNMINTLANALKNASSGMRSEWLRDLYVKIAPSVLAEFESSQRRKNRKSVINYYPDMTDTDVNCNTPSPIPAGGVPETDAGEEWELL